MWSWGWVLMVVSVPVGGLDALVRGAAGRFGMPEAAVRAAAPRSRPASAEAPGDVVLGLPLRGIGEDRLGGVVLDQVAQVHEGGVVGHTRGLLHVVGDDDDGVVELEFLDQLLDAAGRDRIQRRGRLVEQ